MTNKITLDREREAYDKWRQSNAGYVRAFNKYEWSAWQARAALAEQPQADAQPVALPNVLTLADPRCPRHPLIADGFRSGADWMRREVAKLGPLYTHPAPAKVEPVAKPTGLSQGWNLTRRHDGFVVGHQSVAYPPDEKDIQRAERGGYVWVPFLVGTNPAPAKVEPAPCCAPTEEEKALLAAGDYTPEELWGGNRPTCPKCITPAGGEVEVLHWQVAVGGYKSVQCETAERAEDTLKHFADRGRTVELVELVDRAHVTRLQAEAERWKNLHAAMQLQRDHHRDKAGTLRDQLAERDAKACSLLENALDVFKELDSKSSWVEGVQKDIESYLSASAEPSAPVAVVLAEARQWLGDGKHADGLAREHWTPEYAALIDRIDATLSKPPGARP